MSLLSLLIQLPYAVLGKDSVYCWAEKQGSKMNTLTCLFLATGGTSKCNLRLSPRLRSLMDGERGERADTSLLMKGR